MSIHFSCPACDQSLRVPDERAGRNGTCPKCHTRLTVPEVPAPSKTVEEPVFPRAAAEIQPPEDAAVESPFDFLSSSPHRISSADTGPQVTDASRLPTDIPPELPQEAVWWQFALSDDDLRIARNIGTVRAWLLDGTITRQTLHREISRLPKTTGNQEQDKAALEAWNQRRRWRLTGAGVVPEYFQLAVLFDPIGSHVKQGATLAFSVVTTVCILALLGFDAAHDWGVLKTWMARSFDNSTGSKGQIGLIALALYGLGAAVFGVVGGLVAAPVGAAIGHLVAVLRRSSLPKPPEDGYHTNHAWQRAAWPLTIAGIVVGFGLCSLPLWWRAVVRQPPSRTADSSWNPVPSRMEELRTKSVEEHEEYIDPRGRFHCLVPVDWKAHEKRGDARSNVKFNSGRDEIRVIARDSEHMALDDADRAEMAGVMEGILNKVRRGGGRGELSKVELASWGPRRGLQMELEITAPEYLWVRQVKFKANGCDHTLGLYVSTRDRKPDLIRVFDSFVADYQTESSGEISPAMSRPANDPPRELVRRTLPDDFALMAFTRLTDRTDISNVKPEGGERTISFRMETDAVRIKAGRDIVIGLNGRGLKVEQKSVGNVLNGNFQLRLFWVPESFACYRDGELLGLWDGNTRSLRVATVAEAAPRCEWKEDTPKTPDEKPTPLPAIPTVPQLPTIPSIPAVPDEKPKTAAPPSTATVKSATAPATKSGSTKPVGGFDPERKAAGDLRNARNLLLKNTKSAKSLLEKIVSNYPDTQAARDARIELDKLK